MSTVYIINGPNLNLLGQREPEVYGSQTLADVVRACQTLGQELGLSCESFQSNSEGQLIDYIQAARTAAHAIIINPGAYSHTSIALYDALMAFDGPVMEVHISNVHKREAFRHHSYISSRADGVLIGCGTDGYSLALRRIASLLK